MESLRLVRLYDVAGNDVTDIRLAETSNTGTFAAQRQERDDPTPPTLFDFPVVFNSNLPPNIIKLSNGTTDIAIKFDLKSLKTPGNDEADTMCNAVEAWMNQPD